MVSRMAGQADAIQSYKSSILCVAKDREVEFCFHFISRCYFFEKFSLKRECFTFFFVILLPTKPVFRDWAGSDIDGIQRLKTPFVRTAEGKGRFRNVISASSNFANLNPSAGVMQLKRLRRVYYIPMVHCSYYI